MAQFEPLCLAQTDRNHWHKSNRNTQSNLTKTDLNRKNIPEILKVHLYLTNLTKNLTEQNKRSFSSKYLHFHLPDLFFIYDTRAVKAIGLLNINLQDEYKQQIDIKAVDKEYASFFYKCFAKKTNLENQFNRKISTRHFDNILMRVVELNDEKTQQPFSI